MSFFTNLSQRLWDNVLDNRGKLTATGGLLLGIIVTLGFKDFYPDLEASFQRRLRGLRGLDLPRPPPGQTDHVRLEDNTAKDHSRSGLQHEITVGVEGLIGNTPLIKIKSLSNATGCEILAKAEFLNGAGNSPKDRVAVSMINFAEEEHLLTPHQGDTIYEGTVGSTGISLAAVCRARGYKAHMYVAHSIRSSCNTYLRPFQLHAR